ncbi:MAG: phosphotriesterase family protein, partial [Acidimicrobiales bacterium]
MGEVATARGPIGTETLGRTLMHEHVFVLSPEIATNHPYGWDEEARVAQAVDKLNQLKAAGIDSIVDPTVVGLGRYIPRIQRIAEQTELNIVVATGLYTYNDLPHYFDYRGPGTLLGGDEPMVEMFVTDITEGIAGTDV